MHKSRRGAAFYVETILLVLFLLLSLTVLARMLGTARQLSREARQLSCAVRIAQDAAEQLAAPYRGLSDPETRLRSLAGELARQAVYDPEGGNTVWDALTAGRHTCQGV